MDDDNRKYLWNLIQSTGDFLLDKLPEHPNHPKGRNPYAHVALKVKTKFGLSYKDLPDDKLEEVKIFLNFIKMDEG
ncbi:hypothetical protein OAI86_06515 [Alphaproteobacteria bacterium]|nr:hypothetical protein [Alphaproteobacteria bacterium]